MRVVEPEMSASSLRSDSIVSKVEATEDLEMPAIATRAAVSQAKISWAE